jgi:hypothetical protein
MRTTTTADRRRTTDRNTQEQPRRLTPLCVVVPDSRVPCIEKAIDRVSALTGAFSSLSPREGQCRSWCRRFREQKCCTGPLSLFSPSRQARRQCVPFRCPPVGAVLSNTAWKDPEVRRPRCSLWVLPERERRRAEPPQAAAHFACSATNREAVEPGRLSTTARGKRDRDRHQSH